MIEHFREEFLIWRLLVSRVRCELFQGCKFGRIVVPVGRGLGFVFWIIAQIDDMIPVLDVVLGIFVGDSIRVLLAPVIQVYADSFGAFETRYVVASKAA